MSFQKTKIDSALGIEVQKFLEQKNVQTPVNKTKLYIEPIKKIEKIEKLTKEIWEILGLDLSDDSLKDTPNRIAKMMVLEQYWGLIPENFPKCTAVENKMGYDEMIVTKDITAISACEHHGVIIDQKIAIGYIPKDKVIGLSKLNRIAKFFSKRPQIQERCTEQIYHALNYILETEDIGVIIKGKHFCVVARGVEDTDSYTITSKMGGVFKTDSTTRKEFLDLCK